MVEDYKRWHPPWQAKAGAVLAFLADGVDPKDQVAEVFQPVDGYDGLWWCPRCGKQVKKPIGGGIVELGSIEGLVHVSEQEGKECRMMRAME